MWGFQGQMRVAMTRNVISSFVGAVTVIAATFVAEAHAQGPVEKPSYSVGDRWILRTVDLQKNQETQSDEYRVTKITGDNIELTRTTLASATPSEVGKASVATASAANWTFTKLVEGKYVAFSFPLEAGKAWEHEYKYSPTDGQSPGTWNWKVKVEGWEEVRVPAGTFKAIKVVHEGRWSRPFSGYSISSTATNTFWYVPELKWFAKREYYARRSGGIVESNIVNELVSADVKK